MCLGSGHVPVAEKICLNKDNDVEKNLHFHALMVRPFSILVVWFESRAVGIATFSNLGPKWNNVNSAIEWKKDLPGRSLDLPFFFRYKLMTSLNNCTLRAQNYSLPYWFSLAFAALCVFSTGWPKFSWQTPIFFNYTVNESRSNIVLQKRYWPFNSSLPGDPDKCSDSWKFIAPSDR